MPQGYLELLYRIVLLFVRILPSQRETLFPNDFQSQANDASTMQNVYRFLQSMQCHRFHGIIARILVIAALSARMKHISQIIGF